MAQVFTKKNGVLKLLDGAGEEFTVRFLEGSLRVVVGCPRPEELLVLDRHKAGPLTHYVLGSDRRIAEPGDFVGFAARLDDNVNRVDLREALLVGTVGGTPWATTKGTRMLTAGSGDPVFVPAFSDGTKKTVDVQWDLDGTSTTVIDAYEVYFPPERIQVIEALDGVIVAAAGLVYGCAFLAPEESGWLLFSDEWIGVDGFPELTDVDTGETDYETGWTTRKP